MNYYVRRFINYIFIVNIFFIISCSSRDNRTVMVLQERDLVGYRLGDSDIAKVFSSSRVHYYPGFCDFLNSNDLRFLFHSIRDENPSLFGRSDRAAFPTGIELSKFSEKIYNVIEESKLKNTNNKFDKNISKKMESPFLFFIWKEDDSLNPFTRIRRTSFYLFCDEDKVNIVFGEWKKDIIFQNHFTFSEWISSPQFQIQQTNKERFFIIDSSKNRIGFLNLKIDNKTIYYPDWIVLYPINVPDINGSSVESENNKIDNSTNTKNNLGDRLKTLDELKKRGLVSDKEYQEKRKELLNNL